MAESQHICATVIEKRLIRRKPLSIIAASSLYAASRESQTPLTLKELAASSGSSSKEIGRCYRQIVSRMDLKPQAVDAALYAIKVAERAHVSEKAANLSSMIVRKVVERGLEGRNPMTLAAAAVYTASLMTGESMTQSDVAEAANVGEMSVRECARAIRKSIGISSREATASKERDAVA